MATIGERIVERALEILREHPDGLRYSELRRRIAESDGSFNSNTVNGNIWNLESRVPDEVYKPSRVLFRLLEFKDEVTEQLSDELVIKAPPQIKEEDFYAPFAEWLVNEVEDCTKAIPLGGNRFRDKWGTPDVVGKRESKRSDIRLVLFNTEDPENPEFEIRVRPRRGEPDLFYANRYMKLIEKEVFS